MSILPAPPLFIYLSSQAWLLYWNVVPVWIFFSSFAGLYALLLLWRKKCRKVSAYLFWFILQYQWLTANFFTFRSFSFCLLLTVFYKSDPILMLDTICIEMLLLISILQHLFSSQSVIALYPFFYFILSRYLYNIFISIKLWQPQSYTYIFWSIVQY
jgi:hypothetical protein